MEKQLMGSVAIMIFLLLLALLLVAMVSTSMFIGIGYVLSCILPLSLFQGALLSIGASFVIVFSISATAIVIQMAWRKELDYIDDEFDDDSEDEFDGDDYDDDIEDLHNKHHVVENTVKIGRNRPCPCGSGRKYKRCCGKEE
jgi:hypothetical protein